MHISAKRLIAAFAAAGCGNEATHSPPSLILSDKNLSAIPDIKSFASESDKTVLITAVSADGFISFKIGITLCLIRFRV